MSSNLAENILKASSFGTACARQFAGSVIRAAPPEPSPQISDLLEDLQIGPREYHRIYNTFHKIGQQDEDKVVSSVTEVSEKAVGSLVRTRRRYVLHMLHHLLVLGGCQNEVPWESFVYVLMRFCSLSQNELSHVLFLMILREVESPRLHYVTLDQLQQFYAMYDNCPAKGFNTSEIVWEELPLTRYYPPEFAELAERFRCLCNPIKHLQKELRASLPSQDFWNDLRRDAIFNRKISVEFFMQEKNHVFLRGVPQAQETCDLLLPEALGAKPVNEKQWKLRSPDRNHLRISVWGEQPALEKAPSSKDQWPRKKPWRPKWLVKLDKKLGLHLLPPDPSLFGAREPDQSMQQTESPEKFGMQATALTSPQRSENSQSIPQVRYASSVAPGHSQSIRSTPQVPYGNLQFIMKSESSHYADGVAPESPQRHAMPQGANASGAAPQYPGAQAKASPQIMQHTSNSVTSSIVLESSQVPVHPRRQPSGMLNTSRSAPDLGYMREQQAPLDPFVEDTAPLCDVPAWLRGYVSPPKRVRKNAQLHLPHETWGGNKQRARTIKPTLVHVGTAEKH